MVWASLKPLASVSAPLYFCTSLPFCTTLPLFSTTFQVHFVWPLMRFGSLCERGDASLPPRPSLPQIGVEWESLGEKKKKGSTSACFTPSIMTAASLPHHSFSPRSHFYSHTSQPMSSHLHSPACKLYRSVSTNDAYQQWCVFSLHWHWKYKRRIIYNSPMDLSKKAKNSNWNRKGIKPKMRSELLQTLICTEWSWR